MDALICMLGNGSAPLFPDLASVHRLMATQRDFTSFSNSLGSWSFIRLIVYTYFFSPRSSSSSSLPLLDPSTLTPREVKWDKYTYTLSCHVPQHPTLSSFLILTVFQWALLSFSPQFHGCFKTRPTETWFLSVLIPMDCLEVQNNRVAGSHCPSFILGKAVFSQSQQSSWHYGGSAQPCGNKLIQTHLHLNKTERERWREREQEVSPRPIWYACPLLQMNPVWLKPHCVSSPPSFQLPCFFQDLLNHFSANPSFPLVYTHHCGCMLLWKLFRLTFFFYCKCGWLIVDQACCSLVGRQRACLMQIRCLPYAWLLLAAIENTAQMLQFELRPCINSTNLCRRLLCIWLKDLFKKF